MLDVGQGDATVAILPEGRAVVVGAGGLAGATCDAYYAGLALHTLGMMALVADRDLETAWSLSEESLALFRQLGNLRMIAIVTLALSGVARARGGLGGARDLVRVDRGGDQVRVVAERLEQFRLIRERTARVIGGDAVQHAEQREQERRLQQDREAPVERGEALLLLQLHHFLAERLPVVLVLLLDALDLRLGALHVEHRLRLLRAGAPRCAPVRPALPERSGPGHAIRGPARRSSRFGHGRAAKSGCRSPVRREAMPWARHET